MTGEVVLASLAFAAGLGMTIYFCLCWSGRHRGWLHSNKSTWFVLGPLLPYGVFFLGVGAGLLDDGGPVSRAILTLAIAGCLLGMVIGIAEPSWWGPGWLRDLRAAGVDVRTDPYGELGDEAGVVFTSTSRWPSRHSQAVRKQWDAGVEPIEEWQVTQVQDVDGSGVRGTLQRYKPGLLFITDAPVEMINQPPARSAMTIAFREVKEVDLLHHVRLDPNGSGPVRSFDHETPLLCIGQADGHGWGLFKLPRPMSVAERIAEFAGCQVRDVR